MTVVYDRAGQRLRRRGGHDGAASRGGPQSGDRPRPDPQTQEPAISRGRAGLLIVLVAVLAVAVAFVVGVTGLFANPVKSTNANGTATLSGTFEPYQCNATACDGYIQAGARSVFVQFPAHCPPPQRASQITVVARPAPDLGNGSYRATACA